MCLFTGSILILCLQKTENTEGEEKKIAKPASSDKPSEKQESSNAAPQQAATQADQQQPLKDKAQTA